MNIQKIGTFWNLNHRAPYGGLNRNALDPCEQLTGMIKRKLLDEWVEYKMVHWTVGRRWNLLITDGNVTGKVTSKDRYFKRSTLDFQIVIQCYSWFLTLLCLILSCFPYSHITSWVEHHTRFTFTSFLFVLVVYISVTILRYWLLFVNWNEFEFSWLYNINIKFLKTWNDYRYWCIGMIRLKPKTNRIYFWQPSYEVIIDGSD